MEYVGLDVFLHTDVDEEGGDREEEKTKVVKALH
jgi:hypothetical protein